MERIKDKIIDFLVDSFEEYGAYVQGILIAFSVCSASIGFYMLWQILR